MHHTKISPNTGSIMLALLSWAGRGKPVVRRSPFEKCIRRISFLKCYHLVHCNGFAHKKKKKKLAKTCNNKRSRTGTKPPQRCISKALECILLLTVAVQETWLLPVELVLLHLCTHMRGTHSLPGQPWGSHCSLPTEVASNVEIHSKNVLEYLCNVLHLTKRSHRWKICCCKFLAHSQARLEEWLYDSSAFLKVVLNKCRNFQHW